jgi:hypothetical protein
VRGHDLAQIGPRLLWEGKITRKLAAGGHFVANLDHLLIVLLFRRSDVAKLIQDEEGIGREEVQQTVAGQERDVEDVIGEALALCQKVEFVTVAGRDFRPAVIEVKVCQQVERFGTWQKHLAPGSDNDRIDEPDCPLRRRTEEPEAFDPVAK